MIMTQSAPTPDQVQASNDFAAELRQDVIAIELHTSSVGRSRALSERHLCEVADHLHADREAVGGRKRLYPRNQPQIKKIGSALSRAKTAWKEMTVGYRHGIRLLRKDRLDEWKAVVKTLQAELAEALNAADASYDDIMDACRSRSFLGDELFSRDDYPTRFAGSLAIDWSVYNFEPNDELLMLAPDTYQREQARVRAQFELAVQAFEAHSREQMAKLIGSLLDKLNAAAAGEKIKYTEGATTNLREFFDRFERMGITSDAQLTALISDAKAALGGTTMKDLKGSDMARNHLASTFQQVAKTLDQLIVAAPSRSIDIDDLD